MLLPAGFSATHYLHKTNSMAISDNPNTLSGGPDPKRKDPGTRNNTASLSGPDTVGGGGPVVRFANNGGNSLSGPDINTAYISPIPGYKINPGTPQNDPRIFPHPTR